MEDKFAIQNSINVKNSQSLASTVKNIADIIFKESQAFYLPLNQRNVIVLEPDKSLADAYINLFGSGKTYSNSSTFTIECNSGKILEGLITDNPMVLITSVSLPTDSSGKYTKFGYDYKEGVTIADHIRLGICNIPRDIPILFYAKKSVKSAKEEIERIPGVIGYIPKALAMNPEECAITQILMSSASKMFKDQYGDLHESFKAFDEAYKMHNK